MTEYEWNGCKLLEIGGMAVHASKWLAMATIAENGFKRIEMAGNDMKLLEMDENDFKWLNWQDSYANGYKWLKVTGIRWNG